MKNTVRILNHATYGKFILIKRVSGSVVTALSSNGLELTFARDDVAKMTEVGQILCENVILYVHCATGEHTEVTGDRYWSSLDTTDDSDGYEYAEDAFFDMVSNLH